MRVALGAVLLALASGCAPAADREDPSAASALTLANGDRYVVSADPATGKVVLRASVDGVPLPYDTAHLIGKAVLIHPLAGRAETGLYARVTDARANDKQVELDTSALTLEEMDALREDGIVRIYMARSISDLGGTLAPQDLRLLDTSSSGSGPSMSVSGWTGLFAGGFPTPFLVTGPSHSAWVGIASYVKPPSIDFHPQGKLSYSRDAGLEMGLRGTLAVDVALDIKGVAGAPTPIFTTPDVHLPSLTFLVPIGPVPVPVQLTLGGNMSCNLVAGGHVDVVVSLSGNVRFGGSARFRPSTDTEPTRWITAGDWPYELDADLHASLDGKVDPGLGVACTAPRINLDVSVAGITGPYLAVVPPITVLKERAQAQPSLRAGWSSGTLLFGHPGRAEIDLLSKTFTISH